MLTKIEQESQSPLILRLSIESICAIFSALSVAPAISIVDEAIVSNASGLERLVPCLINGIKTMITKPIYFCKQPAFLFIWGVYSGTYIVGNSIDAICERQDRSAFYPKFIGSSIANVFLSVVKDNAFAKLFGVGKPKPMPNICMGLFAIRDSSTILASFSLPPIISISLQENYGTEKTIADISSQLFTPVLMQILSTPLHLYGLDVYNRSVATNGERILFIQKEYVKTVLARMARIFPAFGIAGVVNKKARIKGRKYLLNFNYVN
jgi:hypothetical protein